jgi:predicted GIY-YIG superfamily endonuclease
VAAAQQLLFPDPQPLVERLGRDFFRNLPEGPGVYLMRDANDLVLYVGKAKNLRKRLGSYRVANPDRKARRHLRLLRAVVRIELQECPDEQAAFTREAELLRSLRPKFNRAGTWSPPPRYLAWRFSDEKLYLGVAGEPKDNWRLHGPLGVRANLLRIVLARLVWVALHPDRGFMALPAGWIGGIPRAEIAIHCGTMTEAVARDLEKLLSGETIDFCEWIEAQVSTESHAFEKALLRADLDFLSDTLPLRPREATDV